MMQLCGTLLVPSIFFPRVLWSYQSFQERIKADTKGTVRKGQCALQLLCPDIYFPHTVLLLQAWWNTLWFPHPFWTHYHLQSVTLAQINTSYPFLMKRKYTRWTFKKSIPMIKPRILKRERERNTKITEDGSPTAADRVAASHCSKRQHQHQESDD